MKPLEKNALEALLRKYEKNFGDLRLSSESRNYIIESCSGDGRYLLNLLENIGDIKSEKMLEIGDIAEILSKKSVCYDRDGEQHYNLISALHKSIRSSDADASLYWLARMLNGGEDPLFLARRIIRIASEDIGLADPQALLIGIAARESYLMLGSPEGELALAEAVLYLALAPKSNATYIAFKQAQKLARETAHLAPPLHILNASTKLMKELGYGRDYIYDHDTSQGCSGANNFPSALLREEFYKPVDRGFEREMKKRLHYFNNLREEVSGGK